MTRLCLVLAISVVAGCAVRTYPGGTSGSPALSERPLHLQDTVLVVSRGTGVDVAPDGTIYVTDDGRDVLLVYRNGRQHNEGGPGSEAGQFDAPAGVDATSGLVIYVADAGNHRVQRFSRDFRYLGSIAVDYEAFGRGTNGGRSPGRTTGAAASGRPLDVATSAADELFVAEETRGVVLKWDAEGRPERPVGDFGSGEGQLDRPVGVATDGARLLYVADAGRRAVLVFDLFGAYVRQIAMPPGIIPRRVAAAEGRLLVSANDALLLYDAGGLQQLLRPSQGTTLVEAALARQSVYVLTTRALYRVPMSAIE